MNNEVKKKIENCDFLLDEQKKKVIELIEDDTEPDYKVLVDLLLFKLIGIGLTQLSPVEQMGVESAIKDYCATS